MLDDLLNEMQEQYEEVDSKEEVKEETVDMKEIYKINDQTLKWLEEEREYLEHSKNNSLGSGVFEKRKNSTYQRNSKSKDDDEKESKSKSSYDTYRPYSSYSSSSSSSSKKDPEQEYFDAIEKKFNDRLKRLIDATLNMNMNIANGECNWDILDWQYELNRKRVHDRYYVEERTTKEVVKKINKIANRCHRKIEIAESLLFLKQNPRGQI